MLVRKYRKKRNLYYAINGPVPRGLTIVGVSFDWLQPMTRPAYDMYLTLQQLMRLHNPATTAFENLNSVHNVCCNQEPNTIALTRTERSGT
jgi:hypothetical protein